MISRKYFLKALLLSPFVQLLGFSKEPFIKKEEKRYFLRASINNYRGNKKIIETITFDGNSLSSYDFSLKWLDQNMKIKGFQTYLIDVIDNNNNLIPEYSGIKYPKGLNIEYKLGW